MDLKSLKFPWKIIFLVIILVLTIIPTLIVYRGKDQQEECSKEKQNSFPKYSYEEEFDLGFEISSVIIDNKGKTIISGGKSSEIHLLGLNPNRQDSTLETKFIGGFRSLALHEEARYLVGGTVNGHTILWQANPSSPNSWNQDYLILPNKQSQYISSVAISQSGKLIGASSGSTVLVWGKSENSNQWELRYRIFSGHSGREVPDLVFGDNDDTLFTGGSDKRIKMWTLDKRATLKNSNETSSHDAASPVTSVIFSQSNKAIIYGTNNGQIKSWNLENQLKTVQDFTEQYQHNLQPVTSLAISEREWLLVSGSNDKTVKIWDFCTKKNLGTLHDHSDWVRSVDISSDMRYIVSGGQDKKVILWRRGVEGE